MEDISEYFNILDFRSFTPVAFPVFSPNRLEYFPNGVVGGNPIFTSDVLNSIGYISYFVFQVVTRDSSPVIHLFKNNGYVLPDNASYVYTDTYGDQYVSVYKIPILAPTVNIDIDCLNANGMLTSTIVYLDKNALKARNAWRN